MDSVIKLLDKIDSDAIISTNNLNKRLDSLNKTISLFTTETTKQLNILKNRQNYYAEELVQLRDTVVKLSMELENMKNITIT